ncbi:MAG: dephospho-CoA kinase [Gammaproteobacteria bacterium]|nr:MAG: dephospho-CoA kinase [Gammaproteobacteria bacterium]
MTKKTPLIIGLTGGIASGKTTVANYLKQLGAYIIDTDVIAREVVAPGAETTTKIRALLGDKYLLADGHLNRAAIKKRIFHDAAIKRQYENIILPAIRKATLSALDHIPSQVDYALLVVPLLFEKGLDQYTDYNISVDIPTEKQIQRAISRKPDDETVIRNIIAAQMDRQQRNKQADFIVNNDVDLDTLHRQLDTLHRTLCRLQPANSTSESKREKT